MDSQTLIGELRKCASRDRAQATRRFFKTGPGQYGEGEVFLGVSVPDTRRIARAHTETPLTEIRTLLKSEFHEARFLGCVLLVNQYQRAETSEQSKIADFYFKHRTGVNNWDLVDATAPNILGSYCHELGDTSLLEGLHTSRRHWDRRIAMVATFAFIRQGDLAPTFRFAEVLLSDPEDLMHKATGWMLREAGKRDPKALRRFIRDHGEEMPRTMLRYAIEKFGPEERRRILLATKPS